MMSKFDKNKSFRGFENVRGAYIFNPLWLVWWYWLEIWECTNL